MTDKKQAGVYVFVLKNKLHKLEKLNKQLLTDLRSAKSLIKCLHNESCEDMGEHFWDKFQKVSPVMQRINKALKND